ncbi:MAG: uridine diphosphate-N-acetylglucosamine-binding protein YvcK [Patescibacteria group bacterium]
MKKVVTVGGGSGQHVLLHALSTIPDISITAIVSMSDSGGSSGVLRDEYGVLPPGDILKCLIALSPYQEARDILQTRFSLHPKFNNHNAGNFLLTFLTERTNGDFKAAIAALSEILKIKGEVIPVTLDKNTLCVELANGEKVYGEALIDVPRVERNEKIVDAFLVPHNGSLQVNPDALRRVEDADVIIISPGDLFTSIIPNLLFGELAQALSENSKAQCVYVAPLMTKHGETNDFTIDEFVTVLQKYVHRPFDAILLNSQKPSAQVLAQYEKEKATPVVQGSVKSDAIFEYDVLAETSGLVRHDVTKLAKILEQLLK